MLKALHTSATGLNAQSENIERISHDISNANTDGYKRVVTEFSDLLYETKKEPGTTLGDKTTTPVGIQTGLGVKVGAQHKIFEQGSLITTREPLDLALEGDDGFYVVQKTNGEIAYTRNSGFKRGNTGLIELPDGSKLVPNITIPAGTLGLKISSSGQVDVELPNNGGPQNIGQIQLARFINNQGLKAIGAGLYTSNAASGPAQLGVPGESGYPTVLQGARESSNVNMAESMVDMIKTQRIFEMNSKVMNTVDQMLGAAVNLKQ